MAKAKRIPLFYGLPRIDAVEPIVLRIVPNDIKGARARDPWNCAAARACKRQFGATKAAVSKSAVHVLSKDGKRYVRYNIPPSLKKEAHGLDRGGRFFGGDFQLSPFSKSKKLGVQQSSSASGNTKTGTKKPRPLRHYSAKVRATP